MGRTFWVCPCPVFPRRKSVTQRRLRGTMSNDPLGLRISMMPLWSDGLVPFLLREDIAMAKATARYRGSLRAGMSHQEVLARREVQSEGPWSPGWPPPSPASCPCHPSRCWQQRWQQPGCTTPHADALSMTLVSTSVHLRTPSCDPTSNLAMRRSGFDSLGRLHGKVPPQDSPSPRAVPDDLRIDLGQARAPDALGMTGQSSRSSHRLTSGADSQVRNGSAQSLRRVATIASW